MKHIPVAFAVGYSEGSKICEDKGAGDDLR